MEVGSRDYPDTSWKLNIGYTGALKTTVVYLENLVDAR
jgi:hypothetical protein